MTEPKVVRWDYCLYDDGLSKREEGGFVEYDDYARLSARVQELEVELEKRGELLGEVASDLQHVSRKREALAARVQELEVEALEVDTITTLELRTQNREIQRLREALEAADYLAAAVDVFTHKAVDTDPAEPSDIPATWNSLLDKLTTYLKIRVALKEKP